MRLIAHRGASAHAPENTMAAFALALEMGARSIELDAHQTRDGELVVIHDEDLRRVAGLRARVGAVPWEELSLVDVGSWFAPRFAAERVPRLEDVLDLTQGKAELHLEIKSGSRLYPGIEKRVVDLIGRRRAHGWIVVSSFDHKALYEVRGLDPGVRIGYLLGATVMKRAFAQAGELGAESLHMNLRQVGVRGLRECHKRNLDVLVYTVNKQKDADRLKELGVDGIFSNFPEIKV
ncbi:MAG: glycerophosphodiester phosphodiesterase [Elusimicrobia bacterium]|nr:glycerophosphodiester phosphodiesterase [Elusimicrobiota bacterium]